MRNYRKILLILLIFAINGAFTNLLSGDGFRRPFKKGDYYEYVFYSNGSYIARYSARVTSDTVIGSMYISTVLVQGEPPLPDYNIIYKLDTISLNLYSNSGAFCPDINGNYLIGGFNLPIGYTFNTCNDTLGGIYFKSEITDTVTNTNMFQSNIPLKTITVSDTIGLPVDIRTDYVYSEMFGFTSENGSSGSPFGGPYSKVMAGAVIDDVVYGTILLSVHQISNEVPDKYTLKQNYPNPFNPSTKIQFSIPRAGNVRLVVYDQLGREIKTLVDDNLSAGIYEYSFQSNNLPSGVYFYELNAGDHRETKRMVLIKTRMLLIK